MDYTLSRAQRCEMVFNDDIIEEALSHVDKNEIRRAYNRSFYLKKRVQLMQWCGDLIYNSE